MRKTLLGLCLGMTSILFLPKLPSLWLLLSGFACLAPFLLCNTTRIISTCLLAYLLGVSWMSAFFSWQLQWLEHLPNKTGILEATILNVEKKHNIYKHLLLQAHHFDSRTLSPKPTLYIERLETSVNLTIGDNIWVQAHLKPLHGLLNQGGFVKERWYLSQGITGIVTNPVLIKRQTTSSHPLRHLLLAWFDLKLAEYSQKGIFKALVFGERSDIDFKIRQLFQQTGIAHLLAISGLHIGLLANLLFFLVRPWCSYIISACVVLIMIGGYAALAGFSPPTQRAALMVFLVLVGQGMNRYWPKTTLLTIGFSVLVLWDSWVIFSMSFWLTFAAIVAVFLCIDLLKTRKFLSFQVALSIVLLPIQAIFFSGFSLCSIIVNFFSVPLFCFLIIPSVLFLTLLLAIQESWALFGFNLINGILDSSIRALSILQEHVPLWVWLPEQRVAWCGLCILAVLAWYFKLSRAFFFLPLSVGIYLYLKPKPYWQMHVFDVGPYMAVLVRHQEHNLLYQNLLGYPQGRWLFESQILPTLRNLGINYLSILVHQVGRQDLDYTSMLKNMITVEQHIFNTGPATRNICYQGQTLPFGGLNIRVMWPVAHKKTKQQPACILHIQDGNHQVLLSGTITDMEQKLLMLWPRSELRSTIWVTPSPMVDTQLLQHIAPQWFVQSIEQYSPHTSWQTSEHGQIQFDFLEKIKITTARSQSPWYLN